MALYLGQKRANVMYQLPNIIVDAGAGTRVKQARQLGAVFKGVLALRFMQVLTLYSYNHDSECLV